MKIDDMMAEIRETHPEAYEFQLDDAQNWYVVTKVGGDILGRQCERYEAIYSALKAVRKARPKPMTVAEAKAFTLKRKPDARFARSVFVCSIVVRIGPGQFRILGEGKTEGQAWKAAAAAIAAKDGQ